MLIVNNRRSWSAVAALCVFALLLAPAAPLAAAPTTQPTETVELPLAQVRTVSQSRCGGADLSTPGTQCRGFDAREVREQPDLWVVGFENNAELGEKHVLQIVASFDLAPLHALPEKAQITTAVLIYGEASTTRRSATGDSEYGILPSCNTRLGVAPSAWDGNPDRLVPATDAAVAGFMPATTAEAGIWNVTPQLQRWLEAKAGRGIFVLRGDDESPEINGQAMCLSYVFGINLAVDYVAPQ